jgi:hypothetical protein
MKRWKTSLVLIICSLLMIALCIPVLQSASADDEQTFEIPISKTQVVYDDNKEIAGTLNPVIEGAASFTLPNEECVQGVHVIYTYAGDSTVTSSGKLLGMTKVTLRWDASATEPAQEAPPLESIEPTEAGAAQESTSTPAPATDIAASEAQIVASVIPDQVWIQTEVVLAALVKNHTSDAETIALQSAEIQRLKDEINGVEQDTTNSNAMTTDGNAAKKDTAEAKSPVILTLFWCAIAVLVVGSLVWIAFSEDRKSRFLGEVVGHEKETNENLKGISSNLKPISSIHENMEAGQKKQPTSAQIGLMSEHTDRLTTGLSEINATLQNMKANVNSEGEKTEEEVVGQRAEVIALANRLAGITSEEEWSDLVKAAGYRYVLLQSSPTSRKALIEDRGRNSILAGLMKPTEKDLAFLVPSYHDACAQEPRWNDFYSITDDRSVTYYLIQELAVMHIQEETFFILKSPGKLTRGA